MTTAFRLRRVLVATLLLTAIFTTLPTAQGTASAATATRYTSVPNRVCPIDWRRGPWFVRQLIRCSARHWGVSVDKALAIADRESRFDPDAYNSWSCAQGIYQHLCRYWPGRATTYGFRDWSAFNARANIIVTIRMVRRTGWGPWGG